MGLELLFLPSHAPNRNLIERLWAFVRQETLKSRQHQNLQKFRETTDGRLADLPIKHREKLGALMARDFRTGDDVPLPNA
ncbi:MAG TPA: transposase [Gemmata sp.]